MYIYCLAVAASFVVRKMNNYLFYNDERNKVTNETLQGIRVVKYSGLESVFTERV
jgi:ABC-type bacteriocin/lantibiotic exporter with double-glycine peptidase domain